MFTYNNSVHKATDFTPYELVFRKIARTPGSFHSEDELLRRRIIRLSELKKLAAKNLFKSKFRSNGYYEKKAQEFDGKIRLMEYIYRQPRKNEFDSQYDGLYIIIDL